MEGNKHPAILGGSTAMSSRRPVSRCAGPMSKALGARSRRVGEPAGGGNAQNEAKGPSPILHSAYMRGDISLMSHDEWGFPSEGAV